MTRAASEDSDKPGHPKYAQADQSSLGTQIILLVLSWGGSNTHKTTHLYN